MNKLVLQASVSQMYSICTVFKDTEQVTREEVLPECLVTRAADLINAYDISEVIFQGNSNPYTAGLAERLKSKFVEKYDNANLVNIHFEKGD